MDLFRIVLPKQDEKEDRTLVSVDEGGTVKHGPALDSKELAGAFAEIRSVGRSVVVPAEVPLAIFFANEINRLHGEIDGLRALVEKLREVVVDTELRGLRTELETVKKSREDLTNKLDAVARGEWCNRCDSRAVGVHFCGRPSVSL